jgi:hypothetical protein
VKSEEKKEGMKEQKKIERENKNAVIFCPMRAEFSVQLIQIGFIILVIFSEEYKL